MGVVKAGDDCRAAQVEHAGRWRLERKNVGVLSYADDSIAGDRHGRGNRVASKSTV